MLSPGPSWQSKSRVRLVENRKHWITHPVCIRTHRRKSTCSDVRWLRPCFSTRVQRSTPRCPNLAVPETQELPGLVPFRDRPSHETRTTVRNSPANLEDDGFCTRPTVVAAIAGRYLTVNVDTVSTTVVSYRTNSHVAK